MRITTMKKPSFVSIISLTVALSLTGPSVVLAQSKNKSKANQAETAKIEKFKQECKKENAKYDVYSDENGIMYFFDKKCRFLKKQAP